MRRIIVFGATGYTGNLTAQRLAAMSAETVGELVLAGRSRDRLTTLAHELSAANPDGPPTSVAVADVADPASVTALVSDASDVLISTVGPFCRWGRPAIDAVVAAGATYVDSTGEPVFLRRVFESDGPRAERTGARLLPAFGYDYVPGNLAGALAISKAREAGSPAHGVHVGYFMSGPASMSGGTAASGAGIFLEPSYAFRNGHIETERFGKKVRSFNINDLRRDSLSVGGTEQFALPRLEPELAEVGVYIGAAGPRTRIISHAGGLLTAATRVPGVKKGLLALVKRTVSGSSGGPDQDLRSKTTSYALAEAFNEAGQLVARVVVQGPSPYDLTADLLAWAGISAAEIVATGALGPADAFGPEAFIAGCKSLGLVENP